MMTEQESIHQCQTGNLEAFEHLYTLYAKRIYAFVYHKTFHKETSEEITSETFLKAIEHIQKYDAKKASFSTWLYQIARNKVIDSFRTQKDHKDIDDLWDIASDDDLLERVDTVLQNQELRHAMQNLTPLQREVLTMRYWQDLSFQEISDITGQSVASLKMQASRGVKALKGQILAFILLPLILS